MKFPPPASEEVSETLRYYNIFHPEYGLGLSWDTYENIPAEILDNMLMLHMEINQKKHKDNQDMERKMKSIKK